MKPTGDPLTPSLPLGLPQLLHVLSNLPWYALVRPAHVGDWVGLLSNAHHLAFAGLILLLAAARRQGRLWNWWKRWVPRPEQVARAKLCTEVLGCWGAGCWGQLSTTVKHSVRGDLVTQRLLAAWPAPPWRVPIKHVPSTFLSHTAGGEACVIQRFPAQLLTVWSSATEAPPSPQPLCVRRHHSHSIAARCPGRLIHRPMPCPRVLPHRHRVLAAWSTARGGSTLMHLASYPLLPRARWPDAVFGPYTLLVSTQPVASTLIYCALDLFVGVSVARASAPMQTCVACKALPH